MRIHIGTMLSIIGAALTMSFGPLAYPTVNPKIWLLFWILPAISVALNVMLDRRIKKGRTVARKQE